MIKYLSENEYYDHTGKPTSLENAWECMDQCVMYMGAEETLDALVRALDADSVCDAFAYIFRNYEIPYPGEEDEEEFYESKAYKTEARIRKKKTSDNEILRMQMWASKRDRVITDEQKDAICAELGYRHFPDSCEIATPKFLYRFSPIDKKNVAVKKNPKDRSGYSNKETFEIWTF